MRFIPAQSWVSGHAARHARPGHALRLSVALLAASMLTACATRTDLESGKCGQGFTSGKVATLDVNCVLDAENEGDIGQPVSLVEAGAKEGAAITLIGEPQSAAATQAGPPVPQQTIVTAHPGPPAQAGQDTSGPNIDMILTGGIPEQPWQPKIKVNGTLAKAANDTTLGSATSAAMATSNSLKQQDARLDEADAGIDLAASVFQPTLDFKLSAGPSHKTIVQHDGSGADSNGAEGKVEVSLSLKQLLYDFGAGERDVARAALIRSSEVASLDAKGEDLAQRVALAYIRVLEGRSLLRIVDDTIAAHQELARIIRANEEEGNGTAADVNRVAARLVDINAIRSDITLSMQAGEEEFFRLTSKKPYRLRPVPSLIGSVPSSPERAMQLAAQNNPSLASIQLVSRSLDEERSAQNLGTRPKFELQLDGINNNTISKNHAGASEFEGRAMFSVRYRLLDGGVAAATERQIEARKTGTDENFLDTRRNLESDIRQAYRAIAAARNKGRLLQQGVATSDNVQSLYLEQFKAGQRTVFELLDSQMSGFTARRSAVEARYEGERAALTILRSIGTLRSTIATARNSGGDDLATASTKRKKPRKAVAKAEKDTSLEQRDSAAVQKATPPAEEAVEQPLPSRLTGLDNAPPPALGHRAAEAGK